MSNFITGDVAKAVPLTDDTQQQTSESSESGDKKKEDKDSDE